jgi:hypothetical protein
LIGALACDLNARYWFAGLHDRADDVFDRAGQSRYAVSHRTSQMILDRDAADLCEALVDLQVTTIG